MLIFLILIVILAAIIYLPVNAAISYYYLRKVVSDVVFTSLMTSRKVNLTASAAMVILSVFLYFTMAFALDGTCSAVQEVMSAAI